MSKNKEIETYNDNFIILRNKIKEQDDLICELIKESNDTIRITDSLKKRMRNSQDRILRIERQFQEGSLLKRVIDNLCKISDPWGYNERINGPRSWY